METIFYIFTVIAFFAMIIGGVFFIFVIVSSTYEDYKIEKQWKAKYISKHGRKKYDKMTRGVGSGGPLG